MKKQILNKKMMWLKDLVVKNYLARDFNFKILLFKNLVIIAPPATFYMPTFCSAPQSKHQTVNTSKKLKISFFEVFRAVRQKEISTYLIYSLVKELKT